MKWYWWLLIAIIIIVVIAFVVKSNKAKQDALNTIAQNTAQSNNFDPFSLTQITARK